MTTAADLTDPVIAPVAVDLAAAVTAVFNQLDDANNRPRRNVCLRPGDRMELLISATEDECCAGLVWIRWDGLWPSRQFPEPDNTPQNCDVLRWAVRFEIGAASCAPTADAQAIPTVDEWNTTSLRILDDLAALRRAVAAYRTANPYTLLQQGPGAPMSIEGGCVGATMTVIIAAQPADPTGGS